MIQVYYRCVERIKPTSTSRVELGDWPDAERVGHEKKCRAAPESPSEARFARVLTCILFIAHAGNITLARLHFKEWRH